MLALILRLYLVTGRGQHKRYFLRSLLSTLLLKHISPIILFHRISLFSYGIFKNIYNFVFVGVFMA